jgi:hypothetical protein
MIVDERIDSAMKNQVTSDAGALPEKQCSQRNGSCAKQT